MKRSKVFLAATTCILGIAAFAATKAKIPRSAVTIGCTAVPNVLCATVTAAGTGAPNCTVFTNNIHKQLYTAALCAKKLYKFGD